MDLLPLAALLMTLTAVFAFLNHRFLGLPTAIGVMLISLLFSAGLLAADALGGGLASRMETVFRNIDFNRTLMDGMLSFLLFAGALHVNLGDLWKHRFSIGLLASIGVMLSTLIVGTATYVLLGLLGLSLPYIYCLIFGALISPTDPIAVLAILKQAGASRQLETNITGESLFNDGVGVVVFIALLGFIGAGHGDSQSAGAVAWLFVQEAFGGALLGLLAGGVAYAMLKQVNSYQVEVLITLALVLGGYQLALLLHLSGPIAMVVAGLLIGNHGRMLAMDDVSREHLDKFWVLIDEILNAVLFVLIGVELLVLTFAPSYLLAGALLIPTVLLARFVAAGIPLRLIRPWHDLGPHAAKLMTWAGLRGGISVALALSLPAGPERELIVTVTYCIVLFSIVVQGLTVGRVVGYLGGADKRPAR